MEHRIFGAAVLALLGVQPVQAGVTAPVISGTYYEQNGTARCDGTVPGGSSGSAGVTTCALLLQAPPAGKQLMLGRVSCALTSVDESSEAPVTSVYLAQNVAGSIKRKLPFVATLQTRYDTTDFYTFSEDVSDYLVTAPVRVVMNVAFAATLTLDCQIAGTLRSPP